MQMIYDNHIISARGNTAFALDGHHSYADDAVMLSAQEIREALRAKLDAKAITQAEIGRVLGIQQPNVNKLFYPGKNSKLRDLSYDEGMKLIRAFGLEEVSASAAVFSASHAAGILAELLRSAPPGGWTEEDAPDLAAAIEYGLQLVEADSVLTAAARAAADRVSRRRPEA